MDTLTGESQIVSKAMAAHMPLETPDALTLDGFFAASEGQQLEDMPTPHHEIGWWRAWELEDTTPVIVNGVDVNAELEDLREGMAEEEYLRSWH